jgi:hypothetical protein
MITTEQSTEAPQSVGLSVLVPEPMRNALAELAEADGRRSIGSVTRALLAEALEQRALEGGRE